eukprot:99011-Pleurochrysis_carterae.AAC.1
MLVRSTTCPLSPKGERGTATPSSRAAFPILSERGTSRQVSRRDPAMISKQAAAQFSMIRGGNRTINVRLSPLYTNRAKPLKDFSILRAEHELRQQGARRRDRNLDASRWLRMASSREAAINNVAVNVAIGKLGRAAAGLKHSSMLNSAADVSKSLPA